MTGKLLHTPTNPGVDKVRLLLTAGPLVLFAALCWLVGPSSVGGNISLSYLVPFSFCLSFVLVGINRELFLKSIRLLRVEFLLLFIIVIFGILSLINSEAPFRSFRVLFPTILPMLLFVQLVALWQLSPRLVHRLPRIFIACGLLFSSLPLLVTLVVPSLLDNFLSSNRFAGFFENSNQHAIVLATLLPLTIIEWSIAKGRAKKAIWTVVLCLLLYTQLRAGAKTALLVGLAASWAFYLIVNFRSYRPAKRFMMTVGMLLLALFVVTFGIRIAAMIDPLMASKLEAIFTGGVENYQSIESRKELWREAVAQGSEHWAVGTGAGELVLGISHAHNLILDYFRGIGVFGAIAIFLLCATILFRGGRKAISILGGQNGPGDKRIFACYTSAAIYVVCNQLSDCFGPSTIAALWLIYLPAVLSEQRANSFALPANNTRTRSTRTRSARRPAVRNNLATA